MADPVESDPPTKRGSVDSETVEITVEDDGESERPTVVPPFDLESFARENAASSVSFDSLFPALELPGGDDLPTQPPAGGFPPARESFTDEVVVTLDVDDDSANGDGRDSDEMATVIPPPEQMALRAQMATLTDENELEDARRRSVASNAPPGIGGAPTAPPTAGQAGSVPPRKSSARLSALNLADARTMTPVGTAAVRGPASTLEGALKDSTRGSDPRGAGRAPLRTSTPASLRKPTPPERSALAADDPVIEVQEESLLDVPSSTATPPNVDPVVDMKDRFSLGDYSGALAVAETILVTQPQHPDALKFAEECQRVLIKMYAARIGPLDRVPQVMVQQHELRWLSIDHRAGFLLSLVDGMSSIEMILDVSGMPLLDTLRILHELYQQRIISFRA